MTVGNRTSFGDDRGETNQPTPANEFRQYVEHGWVLCPIREGEKAPRGAAWNRRENGITDPERAAGLDGAGLCHAYSGTCAIDVDNMDYARKWLAERGVDLDALFNAHDAVQITRGDATRGKLLYALPDPIPTKIVKSEDKSFVILEFRCGATTGNTQQDVLPPTVHPSGKRYQWKYDDLTADWRNLPPLPESLRAIWNDLVRPVSLDAPKVEPSAGMDELRELISDYDPDITYDEWVRIGQILHHETGGDDNGLALWNEWSSKGTKYKGYEELAYKWTTFGNAPNPVTAGSLRRSKKASRDDFEDVPTGGDVDIDVAERAARTTTFTLIPLDKFAKREPVRYLVDGLIEVGELFGFIGKRKSGKSYAALDLAFAVAQGRSWAHRAVLEPGPVIWIAAEGARSLEVRRGPQWLAHYGDADIRVWPHPLNLRKAETYLGLVQACRGARLVVIDSLRRVAPGAKENSSDELAEVLAYAEQLARKTGAAVAFIAHAGKADATTARGTSAIEDQLEAGFAVEKLEGADDGKFRVTPVFARDEETGADVAMCFELELITPDGLAPGVIVNWDVAPPAKSTRKQRAPEWLAVTDELIGQLGALGKPFARKAIHEAATKLANERFDSFTEGALRKGVNRALDERQNGTERTIQATAWETRNKQEVATEFELLPISENPDRDVQRAKVDAVREQAASDDTNNEDLV